MHYEKKKKKEMGESFTAFPLPNKLEDLLQLSCYHSRALNPCISNAIGPEVSYDVEG